MKNGISVSEIDGIKTKIASFDLKINGLKMERDQLYAEIEHIHRERLKKIIGMCFLHDDGSMDRILDTDREQWFASGRRWNPYQMRVLKIFRDPVIPQENGSCIPFSEELLYTRACEYEDPVSEIRQEYREIEPKVFAARFEEVTRALRKAIGLTEVE